MKRSILLCILITWFAAFIPATVAFADDAPPTKEQLEQAKKAFGEGRALFEEGKLPEAIEKFKESYRLSKNPTLLYNIGFTLDQAGSKDKALFYYRKFLADAPKNAPQRKEVDKRVVIIEKENLEADLNGNSTTTTTTGGGGAATTGGGGTTTAKVEEVKPQVKVKPAGTYSATDFQHQMIDAAPATKPLDVTAFVPEDSGWTVTLYYRGNGDTKFFAKTMKWRYKELVGRIPGAKMGGSTIQYYIEAKDQSGAVVAKSGKSTSPNLVNIDNSVPARFYPDLTDEGNGDSSAPSAQQVQRRDEEEDPFNKNKKQQEDIEPSGPIGTPETPTTPGTGWTSVGSSKFEKAKWISTGVAGGMVAGAVVTFILGKKQASNLETDSTKCGQPPCQVFDAEYDVKVQEAGQRYNTLNTVTTVVGVGATLVAGYFWYKQVTAKKRGELKVGSKNSSPETTWAITPTIGDDGFTGAAAALQF
ncbi:MAG TPA: hypothetical protein VMZ53_32775 [Kofleriaceae bacterium]|nr:hypothetical protein [Kofleriaceae bacterium]